MYICIYVYICILVYMYIYIYMYMCTPTLLLMMMLMMNGKFRLPADFPEITHLCTNNSQCCRQARCVTEQCKELLEELQEVTLVC